MQLTWMDAKVDDWVVTPRRGKAVEINALWYNALRLMERWARRSRRRRPPTYGARADQAQRSFNERFWYADGGYLFDVVDAEGGGNDPKCRPNQMFAISLPHPVLARERWAPVMEVVRDRLLTPVGLRSLAPGDPDYKAQLLRRSAHARRRLSPGHGVGLAGRPVRRRLAEGLSRTTSTARAARSTASCRTSTRRASDRSARSSTPRRRSRRAAASRRRGASPRCCARGSSSIWLGSRADEKGRAVFRWHRACDD